MDLGLAFLHPEREVLGFSTVQLQRWHWGCFSEPTDSKIPFAGDLISSSSSTATVLSSCTCPVIPCLICTFQGSEGAAATEGEPSASPHPTKTSKARGRPCVWHSCRLCPRTALHLTHVTSSYRNGVISQVALAKLPPQLCVVPHRTSGNHRGESQHGCG